MVRFAIACAVLTHIAGCYDPSVRDCSIECASAKECAGGQVCSSDGFCVAPSYRGRCRHGEAPVDATSLQVDADGASPDAGGAVALCEQGCANGTCDALGVCVLDCSVSGSCTDDVKCPANLPCRVVCGDHACKKKIQCGMATSCDVQCIGASSCADVVQCGIGACDVRCIGEESCAKHADCGMSCACDVTCSGIGACHDPSMCPHGSSCVLGRGCSSALTGCNTCT
jgi:hypothetical protein